VDITSGRGVALAIAVVLAPLLGAVRLRPRVVAAIGAAAVVTVAASMLWNDTTTQQHAVRVTVTLAGAVLGVVIALGRERLEGERRLEELLGSLMALTTQPPQTLVEDIASALVPEWADGAQVALHRPDGRGWSAGAGADVPGEAGRIAAASSRHLDGGWVLEGPLRVGAREIGTVRLVRRERRFGSDAVAILDRLAERLALALENSALLDDTRALSARLANEGARLQAVVDQLPSAVTIRDLEGTPILANRRAQEIRRQAAGDMRPEDWFAAHPGRRAGGGEPADPSQWPFMRALRHGEIVQGEVFEYERRDGTRAAVQVSAAPLRDERGRINGAVSVFDDVTIQHRDRRALWWLAEVGRVLDRPHTVEARIEDILRLLVDDIADAGLLYLAGPDSALRATLAVGPGGEALDDLRLAERGPLGGEHPACVALERRATVRLGPPDGEPMDPWSGGAGFADAAFLPILHAGHDHGCLALACRDGRRLEPEDIRVCELIARRIALALENSRLYAEQHRVATALQRDLLPRALPQWDALRLATLYRPAPSAADVGGDFFDLFEYGGEHMLVVGDVSGKGVEAAATTALVRHAVRGAARAGQSTGERIDTVNRALLEEAPGEQFCTLAWVAIARGPDGPVARLASAGHPPPIVLRAGGGVEVAPCRGTLLGFYEQIRTTTSERRLEPGDAIVLYTDGITEARRSDGSLFGTEGLCAALAPAAGCPADTVLEAVEAALERERATPRDDVAMVVAEVRA
jgi:PAS domain S-box-containing protein